jgi:hypothetical protein
MIEVVSRDVHGVEWVFHQAAEVLVTTVDVEERPLGGMQVQLHPAEGMPTTAIVRDGRSSASGEVRFRRVPPGSYVVVATAMQQPVELSVVAGEEVPPVVMALQPTGYVDVHVTRPDGSPNDEAAITIVGAEDERAQTHPEGMIRFMPITIWRWIFCCVCAPISSICLPIPGIVHYWVRSVRICCTKPVRAH